MLETLRKSTGGILAKILIGLLVLSFAVWGIADVITGGAGSAVAKIGDQEITPDEYQRAYRSELDTLSRQTGRRISQKEAQAIGLDRRVLSRLIGSTAVEEHANDLGLTLSDQALVDGLKADPAFQDAQGNFSAIALRNMLAQVGLSEKGFLQLRRQDKLRDQIVNALMNATAVPDTLINMTHAWRQEKRVLEYFTIDANKVVKLPEPTEKELKDTYEQNKTNFMKPELRQLAILVLSAQALADKTNVPEDDIKASYEETQDNYNTPEQRRIQQISFADKAKAEEAKKALDGGKAFVEVAKEAGATEKDIDLGILEKKAMIDQKIADAAFALEENKASDVVEGKFSTVIVRVTEIKPGTTKTFEDVKDQVREKLAFELATQQIQQLYDGVDDGRAAGKSLKDIADELGLSFLDIQAVSIENQDAAGKKVIESADGPRLVQAGFTAEIGIEREPVQLTDGGFAWVDLLSVTKSEQKTFEEVKQEVTDLWQKNKRRLMLSEIAAKAVERIRGGEDFKKVSEELGGTLTKTPEITRTTIPQGISQAGVTQSFLLPVNGVSSTLTENEQSRSIFKVLEISVPKKPEGDDRENLGKELQRHLQRDQLAEYIDGLQQRLSVSINETAFQRATGYNAPSY